VLNGTREAKIKLIDALLLPLFQGSEKKRGVKKTLTILLPPPPPVGAEEM
jgi:hypothetical protein